MKSEEKYENDIDDEFTDESFIDEDKLGTPKVMDGKFVWDPPSDMDLLDSRYSKRKRT